MDALKRLLNPARHVNGDARGVAVLVAVTASHRGMAFQACEYIMDYLKSLAPFWKKEQTPEGARAAVSGRRGEVRMELEVTVRRGEGKRARLNGAS